MLSLSKVLLAIPTERAGCALISLSAGAMTSFAASRRICMHYVLQGPLTIESESVVAPLETGDFVCLPRGRAHSLASPNATLNQHTKILSTLAPADAPRQVRIGRADAPIAARVLSASYFLRGTGGVSPGSFMADVAILRAGDTALSSIQPPPSVVEACTGSGAGAFATALMRLLFLQAVRLDVARRLRGKLPPSSGGFSNKVGNAQVLLERYLNEHWSVAKLAETVGMSRAGFARRFANATGESPMAALTALRLAEARRLLEGRSEIGEIAHAVGYGSLAAFSRAFRKHQGETPSAYRRRKQRETPLTF